MLIAFVNKPVSSPQHHTRPFPPSGITENPSCTAWSCTRSIVRRNVDSPHNKPISPFRLPPSHFAIHPTALALNVLFMSLTRANVTVQNRFVLSIASSMSLTISPSYMCSTICARICFLPFSIQRLSGSASSPSLLSTCRRPFWSFSCDPFMKPRAAWKSAELSSMSVVPNALTNACLVYVSCRFSLRFFALSSCSLSS